MTNFNEAENKNFQQNQQQIMAPTAEAIKPLSAKANETPLLEPQQGSSPDFDTHRKNVNILYTMGTLSKDEAKKYLENIERIEKNHKNKVQNPLVNSEIEGFLSENPDFLSTPEKAEVLSYLKTQNALNKEQLGAVSKLVKNIENAAIKKFQEAQKKELSAKNAEAINRMGSIAQNFSSTPQGGEKVFTKEDIINMSNKDFLKNEDAIKKQLLEGKLK